MQNMKCSEAICQCLSELYLCYLGMCCKSALVTLSKCHRDNVE